MIFYDSKLIHFIKKFNVDLVQQFERQKANSVDMKQSKANLCWYAQQNSSMISSVHKQKRKNYKYLEMGQVLSFWVLWIPGRVSNMGRTHEKWYQYMELPPNYISLSVLFCILSPWAIESTVQASSNHI